MTLFAVQRPDGTVIEGSVSTKGDPNERMWYAVQEMDETEDGRADRYKAYKASGLSPNEFAESLGYRLVRGKFVEEETP